MKSLDNRRRYLTFGALLAALAVPLAAAEVAGRWSGFGTPDQGGREPFLMELKVNGTQVLGTAGPSADRQFPISEGKVEGLQIRFRVGVPGGPTLSFDLTLDGDTLRGEVHVDRGGGAGEPGADHGKVELHRVQ